MTKSITAVIPILIGLCSVTAEAQWLGPNWETHLALTQQDLDMIHAAVTQQVRGKPLATIVSWSNPASQNSGSIELVKKFGMQNQKCEMLEYIVRSGIYAEHYHFTSCLQRDGTWKIA